MNTIDILNKQVTLLASANGYNKNGQYLQSDITLKQALFYIPNLLKEDIFKLRSYGYDTNEYKEYKKKFPNWIASGTYPQKQVNDASTLTFSNLMAIDIDKHDNNDTDLLEIRKKIFDLPYVVAVPKSISGLGIYAIILVEDGKYTKEYYKYIAKLWNQQYNLNIDTYCTNISRRRFIGYDEEIDKWVKSENTDIQPWKLKYIEKKKEQVVQQSIVVSKYKSNKDITNKAIWKLLNNGYSIDNMSVTECYGAWYHIACEFKHFDDGLDMFIKFSQNSSKYHDDIDAIKKKFNGARIESSYEEVSKKWCGICKRIYGNKWWK